MAYNSSKLQLQQQKEETTYIVFGGVPSLLHVHNVNVQDGAELHLDRPKWNLYQKKKIL